VNDQKQQQQQPPSLQQLNNSIYSNQNYLNKKHSFNNIQTEPLLNYYDSNDLIINNLQLNDNQLLQQQQQQQKISKQQRYSPNQILKNQDQYKINQQKYIKQNSFNISPKMQQSSQPAIANKVRNKKFAAYESILYQSTDSSSSSLSSTPCFSPIMFHHQQQQQQQEDQFNRSIKKTNYQQQQPIYNNFSNNRYLTLCRHGQNCRFKRDNKCKYYHPEDPQNLITVNGTPQQYYQHFNNNNNNNQQLQQQHKYRSKNTELKNIDISDYSIDIIEDNKINELINLNESELKQEIIKKNANIEIEKKVEEKPNTTSSKTYENDDDDNEIKINWLSESTGMSIKLNYKKINKSNDDDDDEENDDVNFEDPEFEDDDEESIELLLGTSNINDKNFENRKNRLLNSSSHSSLSSSLSSSSMCSSKTIIDVIETYDIISNGTNSAAIVSTKLERTVLTE